MAAAGAAAAAAAECLGLALDSSFAWNDEPQPHDGDDVRVVDREPRAHQRIDESISAP